LHGRFAETHSGYKVLVEEGTDRILGARIQGSEASEVINLFAIAIRSGMRATDLKHMLFAYPTSGSNMTRMLWKGRKETPVIPPPLI
jgi:glutathione reductase (NADPH)